MNKVKLAQYTALVKFLGAALGPDYEIVLHDINGKDQSVQLSPMAESAGGMWARP